MAVNRGSEAGAFSETERQTLETLLPHLEIALRVHSRVVLAEDHLLKATSALHELRNGLILTDGSGKVLFANRRAAALLKLSDGLGVNSKGLRASSVQRTDALRTLIAKAAEAFRGNVEPAGGQLSLDRPSGRDPLRLFIAPLPPPADGRLRSPAVVIFVTALEWNPVPDPRVFEELLDLTAAQARLAAALAQGKSLQEYMHETGVSNNTVRTHLKRIYAKLGVARQPELMRVLLTLLPDRS